MFITDILRRSGRSLKSAKLRTLLTALAIAVGTFALTLTLAASNGAQQFVDDIISDNFDPAELIVTNDESILGRGDTSKPKEYEGSFGNGVSGSGAPIQVKLLDQADITAIANTERIAEVREGITLNLQYLTRPGAPKYVGTAEAFNPSQNPQLLAGSVPKPLSGYQLLLPEGYLEPLGFGSAEEAINQPITLAVATPDSTTPTEVPFTVVGVMAKPTTSQPGTELYLYIGNEAAVELNNLATSGTPLYQKYTLAFAKVEAGQNEANLVAAQDRLQAQGYTTQSVKDTQEFLNQIISVLQGIVAAFGAIAVIASVFGIVNTMYISVLQRTREIGLMKALGMRKRDIGRLFRFEAAWIGFLGGAIGSLAAWGLGSALNPWITTQLSLGEGNRLLIFEWPQIVVLIAILIVISTLAGWLPSRKAAKLDPIEALRTE